MTTKNKLIITIAVILISLIGIIYFSLIPRAYIKIELAPQQAFIKIDSQSKQNLTNGDKLTVSPGKHGLVIYRDEFNSYTQTFEVKRDETKEIVVVLEALTDSARNLLNNDDSSKVIEKYTGIQMDNQVKRAKLNYPILKILPIDNPYYRMYSCRSQKYPADDQKVAICISMDDTGYKSVVYQDIKALGYNLDDYELIWL